MVRSLIDVFVHYLLYIKLKGLAQSFQVIYTRVCTYMYTHTCMYIYVSILQIPRLILLSWLSVCINRKKIYIGWGKSRFTLVNK